MTDSIINLGVVGLGRAFSLMLPTFTRDNRFRLVAAATPGAPGRKAFEQDLGGRAYENVEGLCGDDEVTAVYVASPHEFHCEHIIQLAEAGKHLLVDKPLAVSESEAQQIVSVVERTGVVLVTGPSHSFDAPVLLARKLIESGEFGALKQIHAVYHTDFLYRPRRGAELDTEQGGGVIFSQGVHQVDVARFLAGGRIRSVHALTGAWDPKRPTEGAYSALVEFEEGAFAALTYNGYGRFPGDVLMEDISELGFAVDPASYGGARRRHQAGAEQSEAEQKRQRNLGFADTRALMNKTPISHEHFGLVIASCEGADIRLHPDGVEVFADTRRRIRLMPPGIPRREVMDELHAAVAKAVPPVHDARWGMASLEGAIAILESARSRAPVLLKHQCALASHWQSIYTEPEIFHHQQ